MEDYFEVLRKREREKQLEERLQEQEHLHQRPIPTTEKTWAQPATIKKEWANAAVRMAVEAEERAIMDGAEPTKTVKELIGERLQILAERQLGSIPFESPEVVKQWQERNRPDMAARTIGLNEVKLPGDLSDFMWPSELRQMQFDKEKALQEKRLHELNQEARELENARYRLEGSMKRYESSYLEAGKKLQWNGFMQRLDVVDKKPYPMPAPLIVQEEGPKYLWQRVFKLGKWVTITIAVSK